jgi:hypothetical protein
MRNITFIWLVVVLLLTFTACDDEGTTPPPDNGEDGRTPAEALEALEDSFNAHDVELFKDVLAPEVIFHFDPNDVGDDVGGFIIPESWGYDDLVSAVGNMFDQAYSIDFSVSTADVGDPDEGATEYTAEAVHVRLLVMIDAGNGFLAEGFCGFRFINAGFGNNDDWVITDWWDYTAPAGTFESAEMPSLGKILAGFAE